MLAAVADALAAALTVALGRSVTARADAFALATELAGALLKMPALARAEALVKALPELLLLLLAVAWACKVITRKCHPSSMLKRRQYPVSVGGSIVGTRRTSLVPLALGNGMCLFAKGMLTVD